MRDHIDEIVFGDLELLAFVDVPADPQKADGLSPFIPEGGLGHFHYHPGPIWVD